MHLPQKTFSLWQVTLAVFCLLPAPEAVAQSVLSLFEKEISVLVSEARPSVVTVSAVAAGAAAKKSDEGFLSFWSSPDTTRAAPEIRIGSGLILSSDGFIITMRSVIENSQRVFVTLYGGHKFQAQVIGSDSVASIAVLRVTEVSLIPARLGSVEGVMAGAWAIVIGNSMGMPHAVSVGTVNGIREDGMMQISANVDPGHSGSPVFNFAGEAIGLIAAVVNYERGGESAAGAYFGHSTLVWPVSFLLPHVRRLIDDYYAEHGWLGVTVNRPAQGRQYGARVVHLDENGPGKKAGIRVDDVITHFNGHDLKSMNDLRNLVLKLKPGEKVEVGLLRQETPLQLNVEIGRRRGDALFRSAAPGAAVPTSRDSNVNRPRQ